GGILADVGGFQFRGHAGAGEAGIIAFAVMSPVGCVVAEIDCGGVGVGVAGGGDAARLVERAAVGGVLADIVILEFGGHAGASETWVVALVVIGPGGGVVAEVDGGCRRSGRSVGPGVLQGDGAGFEGGLAVGGVMAFVVVPGF